MKGIAAFLFLLACLLPAGAAERVVLFAKINETMIVQLSDGSKWNMEKEDCFPVVAYKESHTKVILQLASASFILPVEKISIVPEKQQAAALENYRANVNTYINGYAARWKAAAEAKKK